MTTPTPPVIALSKPKTVIATHIRLNSITPDLGVHVIKVNATLLDTNNVAVGTTTVSVPFSAVESGWDGSVVNTIAKLVEAAVSSA